MKFYFIVQAMRKPMLLAKAAEAYLILLTTRQDNGLSSLKAPPRFTQSEPDDTPVSGVLTF